MPLPDFCSLDTFWYFNMEWERSDLFCSDSNQIQLTNASVMCWWSVNTNLWVWCCNFWIRYQKKWLGSGLFKFSVLNYVMLLYARPLHAFQFIHGEAWRVFLGILWHVQFMCECKWHQPDWGMILIHWTQISISMWCYDVSWINLTECFCVGQQS